MADDPRCPTCHQLVVRVDEVKTAGATIAYPCGHEVVATRDTRDAPGSIRLAPVLDIERLSGLTLLPWQIAVADKVWNAGPGDMARAISTPRRWRPAPAVFDEETDRD